MGDKTVWLLGAGFSRALGGPLFADLISFPTARWVNAWVGTKGGLDFQGHEYTFDDCVRIYLQGCKNELWKNAEECIALLDRAQTSDVVEKVVHSAFDEQDAFDVKTKLTSEKFHPLRLARVFARFTQFLAIATSHYVPDGDDLPEAWRPFENWMETLGVDDTIVSFNYDRVVETLKRIKARECSIVKPHGTTPDHEALMKMVRANEPVTSICVPGPSKLAASRKELESEWDKARNALHTARRLIVIGYSFPASDALSLDFVLRYSEAVCVDIVLGPETADNKDGNRVYDYFDLSGVRVADMNRYAQTYLTEGTARAKDGKFKHRRAVPPSEDEQSAAQKSGGVDPYEFSSIDPYEGVPKRQG